MTLQLLNVLILKGYKKGLDKCSQVVISFYIKIELQLDMMFLEPRTSEIKWVYSSISKSAEWDLGEWVEDDEEGW